MLAVSYKTFRASIILAALAAGPLFAQTARQGSYEEVRQKAQQDVKNLIEPQLQRYCSHACEIIQIDVDVREDVDENTEIGFESVVGDAAKPRLVIDRVNLIVQIDDNVTSQNRERLRNIMLNHLRGVAVNPEVTWRAVQIPNIGINSLSGGGLQRQLEAQIEQIVQKNIQTYCPDQCMLAYVGVKGTLVNNDEAEALPRNQIFRDAAGQSVMRIDAVNIELALDESMEESARAQIQEMIRNNTRFASPVNINATISRFPQTYAKKMKDEASEDPYGLEKLRQMLIMFRELAGTKEIITTNSSTTASNSNNSTTSESNSSEKSSSNSSSTESSSSKSALVDQKMSYDQAGKEDWVMWGAIALGAIVILALVLKYASAQKDAKIMMAGMERMSAPQSSAAPRIEGYDEAGQPIYATGGVAAAPARVVVNPQEQALKLKVEKLKDELRASFVNEPKVARETFSRMLKEDGVELTSQYLHIFGYMIVLELIDDPNLARDLYALSEFFHKTKVELNLEDELKLLQNLRARQTSSEIRVLTSKGSDKFAFLDKLDPAQIYNLISEEKSQVQTIVLTQLDKKRRMAVFDMYQGTSKVQLMNELCKADAIPKEFLFNVAKALHKKVDSRPEFDTENIRSSEIIVDLLERSTLPEQREIMAHLQHHHPDTSRSIMMKLVTLEFLNYLKDGHLIEIVLGMDREDLLCFLAGVEERFRNLLMSKAPYELVESWLEDLNNFTGTDESTYKLVELKILNKIRNLANSGVVNILDINEMIYSPDHLTESQPTMGQMSSNSMVA